MDKKLTDELIKKLDYSNPKYEEIFIELINLDPIEAGKLLIEKITTLNEKQNDYFLDNYTLFIPYFYWLFK